MSRRGPFWELFRAGAAGARRALARAKVHWGKLDGEKLVKDGPSPGKEHRKPENYYKDVLAGARLVVDECTKDVIFE